MKDNYMNADRRQNTEDVDRIVQITSISYFDLYNHSLSFTSNLNRKFYISSVTKFFSFLEVGYFMLCPQNFSPKENTHIQKPCFYIWFIFLLLAWISRAPNLDEFAFRTYGTHR